MGLQTKLCSVCAMCQAQFPFFSLRWKDRKMTSWSPISHSCGLSLCSVRDKGLPCPRGADIAKNNYLGKTISISAVFRYFRDTVSRTISPGWLRTVIVLISASCVARITCVSHWCLTSVISLLCCSERKWNGTFTEGLLCTRYFHLTALQNSVALFPFYSKENSDSEFSNLPNITK
jgi:hypothetical protein